VVEHSLHQPKVKGSCLGAVTDTGREKMRNNQPNSSSTMVKHSSHQPKVKGSCPGAVTGTGREALVKKYNEQPGQKQWHSGKALKALINLKSRVCFELLLLPVGMRK
jgi:hypothetical protein